MRLYRTSKGPVVERDERFFALAEPDWDALVNRDDLRAFLETSMIEGAEELTGFSLLVEPLSIDEAFLDLTGTEALHGGAPARSLAALAGRIEREHGLTVSIGLSYNKSLAKIASDLDKPRGFAVIGRAEAQDFLKDKPVGIIWGAGKALQKALARDGVARVGDLRAHDEAALVARYGAIGHRLYHFARGEDSRSVEPDAPAKSISAETTFDEDRADLAALAAQLWPLCEKVSTRLKRAGLAGRTVTLKLKTAEFRLLTRPASVEPHLRPARLLSVPVRHPRCRGTAWLAGAFGTYQRRPGALILGGPQDFGRTRSRLPLLPLARLYPGP